MILQLVLFIIKSKKNQALPQSIKYISGKDIDDDWVIYPWDDKN